MSLLFFLLQLLLLLLLLIAITIRMRMFREMMSLIDQGGGYRYCTVGDVITAGIIVGFSLVVSVTDPLLLIVLLLLLRLASVLLVMGLRGARSGGSDRCSLRL